MSPALAAVIFLVAALFGAMVFIASRYKRVPSDKVLVVYGPAGPGPPSARIYAGLTEARDASGTTWTHTPGV